MNTEPPLTSAQLSCDPLPKAFASPSTLPSPSTLISTIAVSPATKVSAGRRKPSNLTLRFRGESISRRRNEFPEIFLAKLPYMAGKNFNISRAVFELYEDALRDQRVSPRLGENDVRKIKEAAKFLGDKKMLQELALRPLRVEAHNSKGKASYAAALETLADALDRIEQPEAAARKRARATLLRGPQSAFQAGLAPPAVPLTEPWIARRRRSFAPTLPSPATRGPSSARDQDSFSRQMCQLQLMQARTSGVSAVQHLKETLNLYVAMARTMAFVCPQVLAPEPFIVSMQAMIESRDAFLSLAHWSAAQGAALMTRVDAVLTGCIPHAGTLHSAQLELGHNLLRKLRSCRTEIKMLTDLVVGMHVPMAPAASAQTTEDELMQALKKFFEGAPQGG